MGSMSGITGTARMGFTAADDDLPAWSWLWAPVILGAMLLAIAQGFPAFYDTWIGPELGLLEFVHVAVPLACAILALRILALPAVRTYRFLWLWLALAAFGSFYVAGEEASWGQHYLQWATPESWKALNDQGETNLHNVSSWFDQKPRALLEIGVVVGGIIVPLAAWRWPRIRDSRLAIILPSKVCAPAAILAEAARMSDRLLQLLESDFRLFSRASEVQETFFYLFILLYLALLGVRLRRAPA